MEQSKAGKRHGIKLLMLEIFPDNPNLLYLRNLRKSAPPFQLNKTGFFTLSCQVYSKIMGCDFTEIEDTTSLSTIVELLYSIDVFNQFVHFILKEPKDQRLFLINLLAARSALLSMQLFFSSIPMENAMRELCNNLDGSEKPLLEKLYASCLFYQNHSSSKSFDKYQIPSWYNAYQKEKLDDAKKQLDWLSSNYTVVFPEKIYYQKALSYFPVVVYNLDKIQKDTQGGWLIKLIPFCDEPFDYIVILNGDEKHIISYAICIPKSFLDELKHSHEDCFLFLLYSI